MATSLRSRQVAATRTALVRAARGLFGRKGYAATTTEEIVRRAAVTEGALYHHFPTKKALFREVFEQVEREAVRDLAEAVAPARGPKKRVEAAVEGFFCSLADPARQQIVYIDAPAVLAYDGVREIQEKYAQKFIAELLGEYIGRKSSAYTTRETARLINVAVMEAGVIASTAPDNPAVRERLKRTIMAFLRGLRGRA